MSQAQEPIVVRMQQNPVPEKISLSKLGYNIVRMPNHWPHQPTLKTTNLQAASQKVIALGRSKGSSPPKVRNGIVGGPETTTLKIEMTINKLSPQSGAAWGKHL